MIMEKPRFIKRNIVIADGDYGQWIASLKDRYRQAQIKAAIKVNAGLLEFYWSLGHDIADMQMESRWGSAFFDCLSLDLKAEFPGQMGFSSRNLRYACRWYVFYTQRDESDRNFEGDAMKRPVGEILHQVGAEMDMPADFASVPWRHHVEIITHCGTVDEAMFYIERTIENGWSRRQLEDNIRADFYAQAGRAITNFKKLLPTPQGRLAQEIIKSPYNFEFLEMKAGYDEHQLEDALCTNITKFLLELGRGFAFVGRQMELSMPGGQTFIPDLIFYHIKLKCYCVVELKVTGYVPEFAGKLNFYVTAVDKLMKEGSDNPTIGILICKSADKTIVEWSMADINKPLGVATYQLQEIVDRTIAQLAHPH